MSTVEDFENAPVGATATRDDGSRAMKMDKVGWRWIHPNGLYSSDVGMEQRGFTLDPLEPRPATAREALDLAWELAHEVEPGQVIPAGTRYLEDQGSGLKENRARYDFNISAGSASGIRTLKPLPEPEPEWLDAPAVIAWSQWDDVRREKVWSKDDECYKSTDGEIIDWSDLRDVTPLYPKEQSGLNPSKSKGIEYKEYRPLLEKAWDEGHHAGQHNEHEYRPGRSMTNPYRQETDS